MAIEDTGPLPEVRNVAPLEAIQATRPSLDRNPQQKEQQQRRPPKKVRDYFHPLSKAVDAANARLLERNLPYRFKVFKRWGEVYIELYLLDAQGKIKEKQRKNISHDDFNRIIEDVSQVEGLFFDHMA